MKLKNLPGISQEVLEDLQRWEDEYQAWLLDCNRDVPDWLDMQIKDPEKLEALCKLAEAAVEEGVILEGNTIVEILPWDD